MYINNLGHMTKMATMPIYGKNPTKFQNLWTNFNKTWHETLMPTVLQSIYKSRTCDDTFLKARSTWVSMHLSGDNMLTCQLKGHWQMNRILIFLKTNGPRGSSAPALELNTTILEHVYLYT